MGSCQPTLRRVAQRHIARLRAPVLLGQCKTGMRRDHLARAEIHSCLGGCRVPIFESFMAREGFLTAGVGLALKRSFAVQLDAPPGCQRAFADLAFERGRVTVPPLMTCVRSF